MFRKLFTVAALLAAIATTARADVTIYEVPSTPTSTAATATPTTTQVPELIKLGDDNNGLRETAPAERGTVLSAANFGESPFQWIEISILRGDKAITIHALATTQYEYVAGNKVWVSLLVSKDRGKANSFWVAYASFIKEK